MHSTTSTERPAATDEFSPKIRPPDVRRRAAGPCEFSSKIRPRLLLAASLAVLAAPAAAEGVAAGCYLRDYSRAHLAARPDQVVQRIAIRILPQDRDTGVGALLRVTLADQGHARAEGLGGETLNSELYCSPDRAFCGIECDGGYFDVGQEGDRLTLSTSWILVGGGCESGFFDLAERPGETVTYLLTRAADSACPSD